MLVAPLRNARPGKVHYCGPSRSYKVNQCVRLQEVSETSARAAYKEQSRAEHPSLAVGVSSSPEPLAAA